MFSIPKPALWRCAAVTALPVAVAAAALAVPDRAVERGSAYDLTYQVVADGDGGVCISRAPRDWPDSLDHLRC
jgi:hypothetical protein